MLTDRYELTMLSSWVTDGSVHHRAVFEAFARSLPEGRRYGLLGGLGRLLELIEGFRFTDEEVGWLHEQGVVSDATADYLRGFRFTGDIDAYPEGDLYFPGSPILTVTSSLGECIVLETLILSVLNHDSAIASAAARMVTAAQGRPIVEMGSRRTHEGAAIAAARAAYVAGFASTSNLQARLEHGIPSTGTSAHSFTLLHDTEREAFEAQITALGRDTTLLVDTYDVEQGVRTAVEVAGTALRNVRLDSGDLVEQAHRVRKLLDDLGNTGTGIMVTSDLDEYAIAYLRSAPVDSYGVGTRLVTGSGAPTASMVYKLVSRQGHDGTWVDVAKASSGKGSVGGRKFAARQLDAPGRATAELVGVNEQPDADSNDRPLQHAFVLDGELQPGWTGPEGVVRAAARHRDSRSELPAAVRRLQPGEPAIPTVFTEA
jgi:nicotinate phosphoribosyltransferase